MSNELNLPMPALELLRHAVRIALNETNCMQPRWERLMRIFGIGRNYANELCHAFDLDPDAFINGRRCDGCCCELADEEQNDEESAS
jgi:hypothetical protein